MTVLTWFSKSLTTGNLPLEIYIDPRAAQAVEGDTDAFLQHARIEPHLPLLLQDDDATPRYDCFTRHEGLAKTPAEGVAVGSTPTVRVPVDPDAPEARFVGVPVAFDGGVGVVAGVGEACVGSLRAEGYVAVVADGDAVAACLPRDYLLGRDLHLEYLD